MYYRYMFTKLKHVLYIIYCICMSQKEKKARVALHMVIKKRKRQDPKKSYKTNSP